MATLRRSHEDCEHKIDRLTTLIEHLMTQVEADNRTKKIHGEALLQANKDVGKQCEAMEDKFDKLNSQVEKLLSKPGF